MALDFPNSPTNGQVFSPATGGNWVWDTVKWTSTNGAGFLCTISDTPPPAPQPGMLWWNSSPGVGQLYCYFNDGSSAQWVAANNMGGASSGYLPLSGGTLTGGLQGTAATFSGIITGGAFAIGGTDHYIYNGSGSLDFRVGPSGGPDYYFAMRNTGEFDCGSITSGGALFSVGVGIGSAATVPGNGSLRLNANTVTPPANPTFPSFNLYTIGADGANTVFGTDNFGTNVTNYFIVRRARGTASAPSAIQNADSLFSLSAQGYAASGYGNFTAAQINISATENWTASGNGTSIALVTTPGGSVAPTNSMIVAGNLVMCYAVFTPNAGIQNISGSSAFNLQTYGGNAPTLNFGPSNFIQYNSSNGNMAVSVNAGTLTLVSTGNIISGNGQVAAWDTNGAKNASLAVYGGGTAAGDGGAIEFGSYNGSWKFACIKGWATNGGGNSQGDMVFFTRRTQSDTTLTEVGRITGNTGASGSCNIQVASGCNVMPATTNASSTGTPTFAWFQAAAYNFPNPSDPRLKEDVTPAPDGALEQVRAVPVHQFLYKGDEARHLHTGFDATEMRKVISHAVWEGDDEDKTLAVNLPDLVGTLWKALQEVTARLEALEGKH